MPEMLPSLEFQGNYHHHKSTDCRSESAFRKWEGVRVTKSKGFEDRGVYDFKFKQGLLIFRSI